MNINSPLSVLKNIGANREKSFNKAGIFTLEDLMKYYPRAYQNRGNTLSLSEIRKRIEEGKNGPFSVLLVLSGEPQFRFIRKGMTLVNVRGSDGDLSCAFTFFNQQYLKDYFKRGSVFRFYGKFTLKGAGLACVSPIYEAVLPDTPLDGIVPVYTLPSGLSQKVIRDAVKETLESILPQSGEYCPEDIIKSRGLVSLPDALRQIHFPKDEKELTDAGRRLAYNELLENSLGISLANRKEKKKSSRVMTDTSLDSFLEKLPFELTDGQKKAVNDIAKDLSGGFVMNRMVTGDVGSGKTAVAAAAAYIALKNGFDCMLMAPTEILAVQHYQELSALFASLGYETYLVTGSTKASDRKKATEALADKTKSVLTVGTHALLSDDVASDNVGLVIIDEQHRFGTAQRAALAEKSEDTSTLVMSATPIPRSLSLILCGNIDHSEISTMPKGRIPIESFVVDSSYRPRLNAFIEKQVKEGHQVYIVCPQVDEKKKEVESAEEMADIDLFSLIDSENGEVVNATQYAEDLQQALPGVRVSLVHGKMKPSEKDEVMKHFCAHDSDVLVSTTVIEVGVNVPNATLMIVENAERFGLSQLHQLRGRVGRGNFKSYFVLVSDSKNASSAERLNTIKNNRDGYKIAEADLKLRGPGDLFSENINMRQHGLSMMKLSKKCSDEDILTWSVKDAVKILNRDPNLESPENAVLAEHVKKYISVRKSTLN